jgi:hypothetical protein
VPTLWPDCPPRRFWRSLPATIGTSPRPQLPPTCLNSLPGPDEKARTPDMRKPCDRNFLSLKLRRIEFSGDSRHEFVKYTYTVAATDLSLVLYR